MFAFKRELESTGSFGILADSTGTHPCVRPALGIHAVTLRTRQCVGLALSILARFL